jgi:serine protease Do
MRVCVLFFALTCLTCCTTTAVYDSKYVSSASEAMDSTKQIIINGFGSGSAFYLGNNVWATAKHCVMEMDTPGWYEPEYYHIAIGGVEAEVLGVSAEHDVALFKIDTPDDVKPFKFANYAPTLADMVFSVGWHLGYEKTFSIGYVSGLYDHGFVHTVPMNPGCSGGPTLNTDFEIIGVNSMILTTAGGFNGVSYSASGKEFLKLLFKAMDKGAK